MLDHSAPSSSLLALWADRLGIGASVLCLLHCLALPFALTAVAGWSGADHGTFHVLAALTALPLAALAAWPGYKVHRRRHVAGLFVLGGLLIAGALPAETWIGHDGHIGLTVAGSLLLVGGHVRNWNLRARCERHVLPHHADHCAHDEA
jgi:hypothetical protein